MSTLKWLRGHPGVPLPESQRDAYPGDGVHDLPAPVVALEARGDGCAALVVRDAMPSASTASALTRLGAVTLTLILSSACGGAGPTPAAAPPDAVSGQEMTPTVPDADDDGVLDEHDACPAAPEDRDGFQDADGCPDADNDADGVPDVDDLCPSEASHRSRPRPGREHADLGCPGATEREYTDGPPGDLDNDGYPDAVDQCPRHAETFPSDLDGGCTDDGDGCPDGGSMLLLACDVAVLDFIPFDRHATSVSAQAAATLDAIAEVMTAHPALSLEVVGHRDDGERGPLGERRAQAVRVALVARGVLASRLSVRDASDAQPMLPVAGLRGAPHAAARDRNRRVDFRVTSAPRTPGRPR